MLTAIFIIYSFIQFATAFLIYKKGHQNRSYLIFFWLSLITWCWVLFNYLSIVFVESSYFVYIVRLVLFFAVAQTTLFYLFANQYPYKSSNGLGRKNIFYGLFALITAFVVLSPLMFKSIVYNGGILHTDVEAGFVIFIGFIVLSIVNAFRVLIRKYKASVGLRKTQIFIILIAAILNWIVIPITNIVSTLKFGNLVFVTLSPLYSLLFTSIIGYALSKHYLFNNRKVLWDSIIYVDYYLKNRKNRTIQYYELQTRVYESTSNHVALDFSDVEHLDREDVVLLKTLRDYMEKQGKKIYFTGYNQKVFNQLRIANDPA